MRNDNEIDKYRSQTECNHSETHWQNKWNIVGCGWVQSKLKQGVSWLSGSNYSDAFGKTCEEDIASKSSVCPDLLHLSLIEIDWLNGDLFVLSNKLSCEVDGECEGWISVELFGNYLFEEGLVCILSEGQGGVSAVVSGIDLNAATESDYIS